MAYVARTMQGEAWPEIEGRYPTADFDLSK